MARIDHPSEYANVMKGLGYGHALYHPPALAELKVGGYGFFDKEGDWHNLGTIDASTPGYPKVEPDRPFQVDVMTSAGVDDKILKAGASGTDVSGIGNLDAHMQYNTEQDFAAVLLARPFLIKQKVDNELFFERWVKDNFAALRKKHEAIQRYGLVVVFKTCSAPYCAISTFGGARKSISAGFSGGAYTPGANAKLEASGDWHLEGKSGVWRTFGHWENEKPEEDDSEAPIENKDIAGKYDDGEDEDHELDEHIVLFISAFHAQKRQVTLFNRDPKVSEMRAPGSSRPFIIEEGGEEEVIDVNKWDD